jgi:hypothetical protein
VLVLEQDAALLAHSGQEADHVNAVEEGLLHVVAFPVLQHDGLRSEELLVHIVVI